LLAAAPGLVGCGRATAMHDIIGGNNGTLQAGQRLLPVKLARRSASTGWTVR